jgi:hypothetical protein
VSKKRFAGVKEEVCACERRGFHGFGRTQMNKQQRKNKDKKENKDKNGTRS